MLVLDDSGTVSLAQSGLEFPLLHATVESQTLPSGLNCTQLLASTSAFTRQAVQQQLSPARVYFGVVMYWFLEGRPTPRMDLDRNGRPCETLTAPAVVTDQWNGGWVE